jgi:hypothetical protein
LPSYLVTIRRSAAFEQQISIFLTTSHRDLKDIHMSLVVKLFPFEYSARVPRPVGGRYSILVCQAFSTASSSAEIGLKRRLWTQVLAAKTRLHDRGPNLQGRQAACSGARTQVVVTREKGKNGKLMAALQKRNIRVLELPLLEAVPGPDRQVPAPTYAVPGFLALAVAHLASPVARSAWVRGVGRVPSGPIGHSCPIWYAG